MLMKLIIYFLMGGFVVSLMTYLAAAGKGQLAAFVALFPHVTMLTFVLIYLNAGTEHTLDYAKGLLVYLPAGITYTLCFVLFLPQTNFWFSLFASLGVFFIAALITNMIVLR